MSETSPTSSKRRKTDEPSLNDGSKLVCRYGSQCYRRNPKHLQAFQHHVQPLPASTSSISSTVDGREESMKRRPPAYADKDSSTFGLFLYRVAGIAYGGIPTVSLKEMLADQLQASAQFNYMFDIDWLMTQYSEQNRSAPLLIVHGFRGAEKAALEQSASGRTNVRLCQAFIRLPYGTHHTKMMLLHYSDGLRIVIHTANMIPEDWDKRTQGLWISPKLAPLDLVEGNQLLEATDSGTRFRADLIAYLRGYGSQAAHGPNSAFGHWIDILNSHDFRPVRVHLIASVSGRFSGSMLETFGHVKLKRVLQRSCHPGHPPSWPLIGQFSSIGSLGAQPGSWLTSEFSTSLGAQTNPELKLIYPCLDDVRNSLEGYAAGGCLPYSQQTMERQPWLRSFLHKWRAGRHSRAIPHIKSYSRISPDASMLAWFLLTSANLSKAAWGAYEKEKSQLMMRSYELGVLFLPQNFQPGSNCFILTTTPKEAAPRGDNLRPADAFPVFPVPYLLPPTAYDETDEPWIFDKTYRQPDIFGHTWRPG